MLCNFNEKSLIKVAYRVIHSISLRPVHVLLTPNTSLPLLFGKICFISASLASISSQTYPS